MTVGHARSESPRHPAPLGYKLDPDPIVLSPERWRAMAGVTLAATARVHQAMRLDRPDPGHIARHLRLPGGEEWAKVLLTRGSRRQMVARCDVVETTAGFTCLEVNAANAGGWITSALWAAYSAEAGLAGRVIWGDTAAAVLRQAGTGTRGAVMAIIGPPSDAAELSAMAGPVQELLSRVLPGNSIEVGTWDQVTVGSTAAWLAGRPVEVIIEIGAPAHPRRLQAHLLAQEAHVTVLSGLLTQVVNDKRWMALASLREASSPAPGGRRQQVFPRTRELCPQLQRRALEAQDALVLKRALSDGGRDVYIGRELPAAAWADLISQAVEDGDWIVQEYAEARPEGLDPSGASRHVIWGVFVVGGQAVGGFGRVLRSGDARSRGSSQPAPPPSRELSVSSGFNGDSRVALIPILISGAAQPDGPTVGISQEDAMIGRHHNDE